MTTETRISRRRFVAASGALMTFALLPAGAQATPHAVREAMLARFGQRDIRDGRVTLQIPPLAENGNSVSMRVDVDSPMTEDDFVQSIHVFAPENPLPDVASFFLTPACGQASVATRIRLGNSQVITAVAEMSDGALWSATAKTVVTIAACVDPL